MSEKRVTRRLTQQEKRAIIADRLAGLSNREIAGKFGRGLHPQTVSKLFSQFRRETPDAEVSKGVAPNYRTRLKEKGIVAIEAGLDDPKDSYKRAGVGVKVLHG